MSIGLRRQQRRRVWLKTRTLHITPDPLLCVLIQEGVSCHVSGLKRFHSWTFFQTPLRDIRIHQVWGRGKDNPNTAMVCWEIARDPSFTAEQVVSRVTSINNELDRIKGHSPFIAHSPLVWNTEVHDSTDSITMEQHLRTRTEAANVYL